MALSPTSSHSSGSPTWDQYGAGSPVDTVTPAQTGARYQDLTDGGLYLAIGPTDADWFAVGGVGNVGAATGLATSNRALYLLGGERDTEPGPSISYFGDAWAQWNGNGQGLYWGGSGVAGDQYLSAKTGATGQHVGTLQDADGNQTVPGTSTAAAFVRTSFPREQLTGDVTAVAHNVVAPLPWNDSLGPDALLDLSTPTLPTVIESGVYAVAVSVALSGPMTNGSTFLAILHLDASGANVELPQLSTVYGPSATALRVSIGGTYFLPAGAVVKVTVAPSDAGAVTRDFQLVQAAVQRLV